MAVCEIVCFRDRFSEFKKISSERVASLPADPCDDFAICLAKNSGGDLGFSRTPEAARAELLLNERCYRLNFERNAIIPPGSPRRALEAVAPMLFRAKDNRFEQAVKEYVKYDLDLKKYRIRSRHGVCSPPAPRLLTEFMASGGRVISREAYAFFIESCHYVAMAHLGGEYGHGAINVFSDSLEFFFNELGSFSGNECHIVFVNDSKKLPVQ